MNYYREIILLPNEEISLHFLMEKVCQQLHLALAENKISKYESAIGISFPEYGNKQFSLCNKLRMFAQTEEQLQKLDIDKWFNRLSDYVEVSRIKQVPENVDGHACFKRIRLKGNREKLARRRAKRKGETLEQALIHLKNFENQYCKLPYINMSSETNGQNFRLFIEKQLMDHPQIGLYSCYGLSSTATVPLF